MAIHASPAIQVRNISKTYRMWSSPMARLFAPVLFRLGGAIRWLAPGMADRLQRSALARIKLHDALQDIDFSLMPGESLGIIGRNGSGKSTLLQIIAGVLSPTSGEVTLRGRVAALLELGSGFNPELSGRENVRINGSILGLQLDEIEAKMDEIVAFADIGHYIDEPVKTYSSGMALRLAFAVQVHIDPEVLIVDEALAVGDAAFQAKAMAKIDEVLQRGTTLLFVGHDLNSVKAFCQRAMLLEDGRIAMAGMPDEVITEYLYRTHQHALRESRESAAKGLRKLTGGYGLEDAHVVASTINGGTHVALRHGQLVEVDLRVRLRPDIQSPCVIFDVMDGRGLQLTGRRIALAPVASTSDVPLRIAFDAMLQQGIYRIRMRLADSPAVGDTVILARQEGALSFEIVDNCRDRFTGLFPIEMRIDA